MHKVMLIGNLARDPELKEVGSKQSSVCKFSLAVNRLADGQKVADFYNVSVWGKLAENCMKYVKKGSKVAVIGDITIRTYDSNDGSKKVSVDVNASEVEFLSKSQQDEITSSHDVRNVEMQPVEIDDLPF